MALFCTHLLSGAGLGFFDQQVGNAVVYGIGQLTGGTDQRCGSVFGSAACGRGAFDKDTATLGAAQDGKKFRAEHVRSFK